MRLLVELIYDGSRSVKFSNIRCTKKEKIKGNSMTVNIEDLSECFANKLLRFEIDKGIQLFIKYDYSGGSLDTTQTSNDLLFNGKIKSIKKSSGDKFRLSLNCIDRSFDILNKIWGKSYSGTAPNIVLNIMQNASFTGDGDYIITSELDGTAPYDDGIQSLRPDDSAFPSIKFGLAHKPVYEFLDNISQPEYTNTEDEINNNARICKRPFKYYIDTQNVFHWFYPTDTPDLEMTWGATAAVGDDTGYHRIIDTDLQYSQVEEVNYIIYKAGEDMDNAQILDFSLDSTSKASTTADSFRNWEDIAREMKKEDLEAGNILFVQGDEYSYPDGGDYPLTPGWLAGSATVANDSAYNTAFKTEAKRRADSRAQGLFRSTELPIWHGKIKTHGEIYEPTNLIQYNRPEHGINDVKLRITSVDHTISKSSFNTTLNVEEDVEEEQ